jgi:hypothetical protein
MNKAESSTPRTDAFCCKNAAVLKIDEGQQKTIDFARKLERERDEARANAKTFEVLLENCQAHNFESITVEAERDQLRKVCDALAADLIAQGFYKACCSSLTSHSELPHVKKEQKCAA